MKKIEESWSKEEVEERTNSAIKHLAQFIPSFASATVGGKPLFGAQQIPGDDPTLRVAEVSFPTEHYARCEIVKVSSVMDMMDAIVKQLIELNYVDKALQGERNVKYLENLSEEKIKEYAQKLAKQRDYPQCLADRNTSI
jgi:hypothetical protein